MDQSREEQLRWVRAVLAHLGVNATQLAKRAGIAPSTLNRPLNEADYAGHLSGRIIGKIAEVAGLKPMEFPRALAGFGEADAERYSFSDPVFGTATDRAVRELAAGRNGRDPWVMKSHALELSGVLPGDIMIVDLNMQPRPRDLVCAQVYDWKGSRAETIFRLFEPPWLLTHSAREAPAKPLAVDGETVAIKGVVTAVLRSRAQAA